MRRLPTNDGEMPTALTKEREANHLAALAMSDSLRSLTDVLLAQWNHIEDFEPLAKHGVYPINRALFYGPPGNGKTVAAQLIASKLQCPLYRVCCEALISAYIGDAAKHVGEVMTWLEQQDTCVVLWDEVESIFPSRKATGGSDADREISSAMTVFWQRLDRWRTPQVFLLATNMKDRLDPALCSRIELQLEFGPPTAEQASDVVSYWSEVFHEYGAELWAGRIQTSIANGDLPESFRALWQEISNDVRRHVVRDLVGSS